MVIQVELWTHNRPIITVGLNPPVAIGRLLGPIQTFFDLKKSFCRVHNSPVNHGAFVGRG